MSIGWPQTFGLDLDQVRKALVVYEAEPGATTQTVGQRLGIGKPKVEGLNAWLKYLRLRDPRGRTLTPLGFLIRRADPEISRKATLCVLHYVLTSNAEATVWYEAINHFLPSHSSFSREDLNSYYESRGIGQHSPRHLKTDIGLFLSTYTGHDRRAFQSLGLLQVRDGSYLVGPPSDLDPLIVGFCLFYRLETGFRESTTSVSRLMSEDRTPGVVFHLTESQLRQKLATLESVGFISATKIADIDGITYTWSGTAISLLEQYYEEVI